MTTQELKQQIDKVLGNSIRCLLPSYWWKRLFNQVADRIDEVEQTTSKLIDSKVEEVKMPIVESVDELEKLNVERGGVAAVEKAGEPVTVKMSDCYFSTDYEEDWEKYTIVKRVEKKDNAIIDNDVFVFFSASKEMITKDAFQVNKLNNGMFYHMKWTDGEVSASSLEEVNKALSSGKYRAIDYLHDPDDYFTFYSEKPQPSLFIKGDSWEKLSKEHVVSSEEELNALSVENGTIAKVVSGDRIVGSFNSLAVGDRVDDVEFMQPPYAFGSCSVMFKDKDGNDIGFGVDSNGIECQFGLVTRDVGTIIFGNEKGINQDLYNQAMTIFKEKECTFEWVEGELPVDSFVRPVTKTPIVSNAYIKGETWTRLLKEGDAAGLEVRELYIIGDDVVTGNVSEEYTAEQLAHNKETVDLYKQGKVSLVMNAIIKTLNLDISCTPLNYINTDNGTVICYEVNAVIARAMILVNVDNTGNAQLFSDDISSGSITIDSELSDTSENPVQNKAIKAYVDEKTAIGEGVEFREFYISSDSFANVEGELTEQQKAYNIETAELVKRGKAVVLFGPSGTKLYCCAFGSGAEAGSSSFTFQYAHFYLYSLIVDKDGNVTLEVNYKMWLDSELSETSGNAIQNKVITAALNNKADKSDIKTINGVSLLGGGNLQLGDGQTIVYDDSAVYGRIAEVEELAAQAKVSSEIAIEELNAHLEEVNEGLLEQVSQLMKDLDDLAERVRALENK